MLSGIFFGVNACLVWSMWLFFWLAVKLYSSIVEEGLIVEVVEAYPTFRVCHFVNVYFFVVASEAVRLATLVLIKRIVVGTLHLFTKQQTATIEYALKSSTHYPNSSVVRQIFENLLSTFTILYHRFR